MYSRLADFPVLDEYPSRIPAAGWNVWRRIGHEAFFGKGVVLLLCGMAIFLLEMGLIVARQVGELRRHGAFLIGFGLVKPVLSAAFGVGCGLVLGLSPGGAALLATLAASASYTSPCRRRCGWRYPRPTRRFRSSPSWG